MDRPDPELRLEPRAIPRVLKKLLDHRLGAPGDPLSFDALLECGWPGERILPLAAASRVHAVLSSLRRLGLRAYLLTREDGWLLDPERPVRRVPRID